MLDGGAARFTNPDIRPLKSLQLNSVFHIPPQFPSPTEAMAALVILLASVWLLLQCDLGWELSAHGYRGRGLRRREKLRYRQQGEPPPPSSFPLSPSRVSPSLNFPGGHLPLALSWKESKTLCF